METKKHILFLCSWFPNKNAPTLGNFVQKHAENAAAIATIDVLYATSCEKVCKITITDNTINNVRTVIVYFPKTTLKIPFLSNYIRKIKFIKALQAGYQHLNQSYNLIHLNIAFPAGIFALQLAKKNIPYILTEHWTGYLNYNKTYQNLPFYVRKVHKEVYRNARLVLPVSEHLGKSLKNLGLVTNYVSIPNIIDENIFFPSKEAPNSTPHFIHISTFDDAHKNISGMLTAFSRLERDYKLCLISETEEKEVWEMLAKFRIPLEKCVVKCQLSAAQIATELRKADCMVLFSNRETFSVVLGEAWTCGIPAIYSKCGGLTEINNPELGTQIAIKDDEALFNALSNFNAANYSKEKIHNFSKQFSAEKVKTQLVEIYSQF